MKSFMVEVEKIEKKQKKVKDAKGLETIVLEDFETKNPVEIVPVKIEKGRGMGSEYLAPKGLSTMTPEVFFNLFTLEDIWNKLLKPKVKQFCATITTEASIEAGRVTSSMVKAAAKKKKFIEEKPIQDEDKFYESFKRMFQTLSPRGESLAGLTRQQNELVVELCDLDSKAPDYKERTMALIEQINKLRDAINDKKDESKEGDAEETEPENKAVAA